MRLAVECLACCFLIVVSTANGNSPPSRFKNDRYGISFEYSDKYELTGSAQLSKMPCPILNGAEPQESCVMLARVTIPSSAYPNTDFVSASLDFSVNEKLDLENCERLLNSSIRGASNALINGVPFKTAALGDSGSPGIVNNVTAYISYKNNTCYEITLQYGGTPAAVGGSNGKTTVAAVDYSKVERQLQAVLRTLRIETVRTPLRK